ncbi:MAG TPA: ABC transporter ATP-binding protein [Burkholderiaceae bacterium]|nr:ABC transporter ATP-binding protein [Burkholderiaceae bacterium]
MTGHEASRPERVLLDVRGLRVAYGKAEVVRDVSFDVRAGEFVVILGRNGAGKSTILHAISGLIPKRAGTVVFEGRDLSAASPREIVQAGIVQVLEGHRVFQTLSVEDNLLIGTYAKAPRGDRGKLDRVYALFPELAERRGQMASRLSGGQQQILAVAQGVIGEPRLLVLDEPSGGLAPIVIDRILDVAARLCAEGLAILLVEQLVEKALRHAHHGYLVETGRIAHSAPAAALRDGDTVRRVYLGGEPGRAAADTRS